VEVLNRALYTLRFPLMGGSGLVRFVATCGTEHAEVVMRKAERVARRIEAKFSRYRPQSVLSEINHRAAKEPVVVDEETEKLIRTALELHQTTFGRFDPTIGVLRRAWDFKAGRIPSTGELAALLPLVRASAVELRCGTVRFHQPGMELDLGGVGKEYAVDTVADLLASEGVESALVNFAGDVRTVGQRGDGRPWTVGVQDPRNARRNRLTIALGNGAGIATSGDYERAFMKDGIRYHHLLDARTGLPARGLASATVVAPTTFRAGCLATAAFLLGPTQGLALLESTPGAEGVLITESGQVLTTGGFATFQEPVHAHALAAS
jgi:thiamine biosynthesis lipoprotein